MNPLFLGRLWRVTTPNFVAGAIEAQDGTIIYCAPILRKQFGGTNISYLREVCNKRSGWHCNLVDDA